MGTAKLQDYMRRYKINMPKQLVKLIVNTDETDLQSLVNPTNFSRVHAEGIDLLKKLLVYDKNERITPTEALKHPYFDVIRAI